jgi:hypothetical protein
MSNSNLSSFNLKEIFKNIKNDSQESYETYSLNIITKWLKDNNLNYVYNSCRAASYNDFLLYEHGVTLILNNLHVSIQTHPMIAGSCFAETLKKNNILSDTRHETPEKLFEYLNEIILEDKTFTNQNTTITNDEKIEDK